MDIENRSFFWMHPKRVNSLKRLDDDNNAIEMSLFMDESRVMHVYCIDDADLNNKVD